MQIQIEVELMNGFGTRFTKETSSYQRAVTTKDDTDIKSAIAELDKGYAIIRQSLINQMTYQVTGKVEHRNSDGVQVGDGNVQHNTINSGPVKMNTTLRGAEGHVNPNPGPYS